MSKRLGIAGILSCLALGALVGANAAGAARSPNDLDRELVRLYEQVKARPDILAMDPGLSGRMNDRAALDAFLARDAAFAARVPADRHGGQPVRDRGAAVHAGVARALDRAPRGDRPRAVRRRPGRQVALPLAGRHRRRSVGARRPRSAPTGTLRRPTRRRRSTTTARSRSRSTTATRTRWSPPPTPGAPPAPPATTTRRSRSSTRATAARRGDYTCAPSNNVFALGTCTGSVFGSDPALYWNDNNEVFLNYMLLCATATHDQVLDGRGALGRRRRHLDQAGRDQELLGHRPPRGQELLRHRQHPGQPLLRPPLHLLGPQQQREVRLLVEQRRHLDRGRPADRAGRRHRSRLRDRGAEERHRARRLRHPRPAAPTAPTSGCSTRARPTAASPGRRRSWCTTSIWSASPATSTRRSPTDRGINPFGAIDVDNSGGACDGTLYATYSDFTSGGATENDVWVTRSTNGGTTWSAPVKVNDDGLAGRTQFHPFLQVDQSNGSVVVAWHDARNDANNRKVDYYAARSTNCGVSLRGQRQGQPALGRVQQQRHLVHRREHHRQPQPQPEPVRRVHGPRRRRAARPTSPGSTRATSIPARRPTRRRRTSASP